MQVMFASSLALLAGCAGSGPVHESVSSYMDCDALQQAVASADNGFDEIKRSRKNTRFGEIWQTDVQAFANACTIVSTSGPGYYTCSGQIETDATTSQLEAASDGIGQCLGTGWSTSPAGDGAIAFSGGAGTPTLTLKSFANDRGAQMVVMRIDQP
ncbi:hypothetical protein [Salinicola aestuarinus]|uniref:hypothetical protein n=1 Tax=Salinicola aestuarinus TaxID=1949082 RepID=UPI001300AE91|nr:hypothetical protein [Salinicola aestuarinus]